MTRLEILKLFTKYKVVVLGLPYLEDKDVEQLYTFWVQKKKQTNIRISWNSGKDFKVFRKKLKKRK